MVKNIILDIGGVIFDDSTKNINNVLNEDSTELCNKVYGKAFKDCVLGNLEVSDYIEKYRYDEDYDKIKYILNKDNLKISYPLMKENYDYICNLKNRGYNLYILSNIARESYEYVMASTNIDKVFNGGVYSFQEHLVKPDEKIFKLLVNRYNLNKEETIFFDDRERNVIAGNNYGIKSFVFKSVDDIERELCND